MNMQLAQAALNLLVAGCLGAAIGFERQWRQRLAGLRTNTLVALGAAIFVTYARIVLDDQGATRIAAQVVSGIGFLGAGVIFKEGLNVQGLDTAATLWCSAAVGLIAGEGFALYGLLAAALVIGANTALRPIVHAINRQPVDTIEEEQHYLVSISCRPASPASTWISFASSGETIWAGSLPAHLPGWLLMRVLAYRIQAAAFGDLDRAILRRLRESGDEAFKLGGARPFATRGPTTREGVGLKSGARLAGGRYPLPAPVLRFLAVSDQLPGTGHSQRRRKAHRCFSATTC